MLFFFLVVVAVVVVEVTIRLRRRRNLLIIRAFCLFETVAAALLAQLIGAQFLVFVPFRLIDGVEPFNFGFQIDK